MKSKQQNELKEDMETLLSMAIEVKKNNTDEFMTYFKGRVNGLISKYFGGTGEIETRD